MDQHSDPQYKTEDGNAVRIWRDTAPNNFLTQEHGRPIFDEVIYAAVISPGSGNSMPIFELVRILDPLMKHPAPKYGAKYAEFSKFVKDFESEDTTDTSLAGTPLSQWSEMTRSMVATMKVAKIFTVDALAALPDTKLPIVGPDGRTWREKAIAYIEAAKNGAHATKLAVELQQQRDDNAAMKEQMTAMAAQIAVLQAKDAAAAPEPGKPQVVYEEPTPTPPAPAVAYIPPPINQDTLQPII